MCREVRNNGILNEIRDFAVQGMDKRNGET